MKPSMLPGWRRGLVLLGMWSLAQACHACSVPPAKQLIGVDAQIAQATDISVATVVKTMPLENGIVEYGFVVRKRLLGPAEQAFTLLGMPARASEQPVRSHDHSDDTFWKYGGGRLMNRGDCRIHPRFEHGESYLVFRKQETTRRSFERIATVGGEPLATDQWLMYVEAKLNRRDIPQAWRVRAERGAAWGP